tara:strand:- start:1743 stop:2456 length:714 start_codon:yes stop_codon:yes gene_type:complete
MPKAICKDCGYKARDKHALERHLNRVYPCKSIIVGSKVNEITEEEITEEEITEEEIIEENPPIELKKKTGNNDLVLHQDASILILMHSFYQLVPFIFAIYYGVYDSSIITFVTCLTSINFWRDPRKNSIRRYIDINCTVIGIYYHLYLIYYYSLSTKYYYMIGLGSLLYPIEYKIPKHKYYYIAICHCILQRIACILCIHICYDINNITNNTVCNTTANNVIFNDIYSGVNYHEICI